MSPALLNPHELPLSRLWPCDEIEPLQFAPPLPLCSSVFLSFGAAAPPRTARASAPELVPPPMVTFVRTSVADELSTNPLEADPPVLLASVTFVISRG